MNYNQECIFLRKKLIKRPIAGKRAREIQTKYICAHKKNLMGRNGCPPPNVCEGFKPVRVMIMHYGNH